MIQPENASNAGPGGDLAVNMDIILRAIQGYEGKTDQSMDLLLDMQKKFEEKLEALRQENRVIKAWLDSQEDTHEKDENSEDSDE